MQGIREFVTHPLTPRRLLVCVTTRRMYLSGGHNPAGDITLISRPRTHASRCARKGVIGGTHRDYDLSCPGAAAHPGVRGGPESVQRHGGRSAP